jgi:hypothetical protein
MAEDRIAVAQEVAGELSKGKSLPQLLGGPLRGRVSGNIEVQNAPSVMGQDQKHVKDLEANRGHGEEIDGDQLLGMILEEGAPSLEGGLWQRTMYLLTLLSAMSMPSLSSSPWMRGAPHPGFSRHILWMSSRTSCEMMGMRAEYWRRPNVS